MKIALKELRETYNCLRIIKRKKWSDISKLEMVLNENNQLISIFIKSIETAQKNLKKESNLKNKDSKRKSLFIKFNIIQFSWDFFLHFEIRHSLFIIFLFHDEFFFTSKFDIPCSLFMIFSCSLFIIFSCSLFMIHFFKQAMQPLRCIA